MREMFRHNKDGKKKDKMNKALKEGDGYNMAQKVVKIYLFTKS